MKISMYLRYTLRSLWREGQHTLLAIFCIAIGVMAIVALQLIGGMVLNAYTSNVRDLNGGDIVVSTQQQQGFFRQQDLSFFAQLKTNGTIAAYTPIVKAVGTLTESATFQQRITFEAVDPGNFPLVTPPTFLTPTNGSLSTLLTHNQAVVSKALLDQYGLHVGDSFDVHTFTPSRDIRTMHVTIAGVIANTGLFTQTGGTILVSLADFQVANLALPLPYDQVYVTTVDQAHATIANSLIEGQFYFVGTTTVANLLKNNQMVADLISKFLEMAGLLALLIGGVGIVNTMQVMLSRRKTEIAMLKTVGYRRRDLYLLFGLEAALLGFTGGILGAGAATGLSYVGPGLAHQTFGLNIPFLLDPLVMAGGVVIGLATALIFGLLPIVQAANIRPLNVLRELPDEKRLSRVLSTCGLLVILSVLFSILASIILKNALLGISAVYGTFLFLTLLSAILGIVVPPVSRLSVPERFSVRYLALIAALLILALFLTFMQPAFGILSILVSLLCVGVILFPRTWKVNTKIALRNIGRQRARTTTTMLALFVGVFTIGLILIVGQSLRTQIDTAFTQLFTFNVSVLTTGADTDTLQTRLETLPGLQASQQTIFVATVPQAVNGVPIKSTLPTGSEAQPSAISMGNANALEHLSTIEGYDVTDPHFPGEHNVQITNGRGLKASDAGTNNVVVGSHLVQQGPLHLKIGSTITLTSADGKRSRTVTVVGAFNQSASDLTGDILAPESTAQSLGTANALQSIHYLKIAPASQGKALSTIGSIVPGAFAASISDFSGTLDQFLQDFVLILTALASLSILAAVIIVANTVALAMLERRRELGILKAVGYTSRIVLSEVMIEYAIVGATGATLAMVFVIIITNLLQLFAFQTLGFGLIKGSQSGVNPWYVIGLIVGMGLLAMAIAALVAWRAVRVRPLEVLRYE